MGVQSAAEVDEVIRITIDGKEVEISDQIQLYATNAQLVHPAVSPLLQPSLAGLPPLFILCGDSEVLRDEILYFAHRAARPKDYPLRSELLDRNSERAKLAREFDEHPTKVHLQVYGPYAAVLTLTHLRRCCSRPASFLVHPPGTLRIPCDGLVHDREHLGNRCE